MILKCVANVPTMACYKRVRVIQYPASISTKWHPESPFRKVHFMESNVAHFTHAGSREIS